MQNTSNVSIQKVATLSNHTIYMVQDEAGRQEFGRTDNFNIIAYLLFTVGSGKLTALQAKSASIKAAISSLNKSGVLFNASDVINQSRILSNHLYNSRSIHTKPISVC